MVLIDEKASFRQNLKTELLNKGISSIFVANNINLAYDLVKTRSPEVALVDAAILKTIDEYSFSFRSLFFK